MTAQVGETIEKKKISVNGGDIKQYGTYEAVVKLHPGIAAKVKVEVTE